MFNQRLALLSILLVLALAIVAVPLASMAQEADSQTPPAKRSKLDIEEEEELPPAGKTDEEQPPAAAKSKLDTVEEEEEPPAKAAPPKQPSPGKSKLDEVKEEEEELPPNRPSAKKPASSKAGSGKPALGGQTSTSGGANAEDGEIAEEGVYDTVFLNDRPVKTPLQPMLISFPLNEGQKNQDFVFNEMVSNKTGKVVHRVKGRAMTRRIVYYEQRMLTRAAEALGLKTAKLTEPGATFDLTAQGMAARFDRAETLLVTALAEHDSAVQQNIRQGLQWNDAVRAPLMRALTNVRLSRIDHQIDRGELSQALSACDALLADGERAQSPELLRSRIERILLTQGRGAFEQQRFADARQSLEAIRQRYPAQSSTPARELRDEIIGRAGELARQADELIDRGKIREARDLGDLAAVVWPELPQLDALRNRLGDYPLLECAYTELPVNFSPLSARSPVERHAVALMFESLVQWSDDARMGPHYECQLARGRPISMAHGRQFVLHQCRWSDSTDDEPHLCTVEDVRWTAEKLLANENVPGYVPAWRTLFSQVSSPDNDPFRAAVRLKRDHWQPLSLMDFKVLPRHAFPGENLARELAQFNEQPVGTGPYKLAERTADAVRFVANPHYRMPGLPKIREISFNRLPVTRSVESFLQDKVHLIYGLGPEQVNQLQNQGRTVKTLRNRSAWFLAPRYKVGGVKTPLANRDLRLAIAHAIDRNAILNQFFRPGRGASDHAPLTGPFPKRSGQAGTPVWAYNTQVPDFDTAKASVFAATALAEFKSLPPIRLAYPSGDEATEAACKQIQAQVAAATQGDDFTGVQLVLEPIAAEKFHATIIDNQSFDLVYWRHDYEDESYWIWPLLDPAGEAPGGANFMGYDPDSDLLRLFQDLRLHKRFPLVQELTHKIHDHLARNAVVIPLWQLDSYVAVHDSLENASLKPVGLFSNVQQWSIRAKAR